MHRECRGAVKSLGQAGNRRQQRVWVKDLQYGGEMADRQWENSRFTEKNEHPEKQTAFHLQNWPAPRKGCRWVPDHQHPLSKHLLLVWKFIFWSIVDLQHCVNFCCTAKWFRYIYIYIYIYIFLFIFSSIVVYRRILNLVPCAIQ